MNFTPTRIHIVTLILTVFAVVSCSNKNWIISEDNACKLFDPHPVEGQLIKWQGPCMDSYANGYGVLSVYENGQLSMECEGYAQRGYIDGFVLFSIYKDNTLQYKYEETWYKGIPAKRTKNITLETLLSTAKDARQYLHLLKQYKTNYPEAWIDGYHQILLEKTTFTCQRIDISTAPSNGNPLSTSAYFARQPMKIETIPKGELLFKVFDPQPLSADAPPYICYTLFFHRVASLKELAGDRFIPGGNQIIITNLSKVCSENGIPEKLPDIPIAPDSGNVDKGNNKGYWYPQKKEFEAHTFDQNNGAS